MSIDRIDAVKSGDRDVAAAYVKRYQPDRTVDVILGLRNRLGESDLAAITINARTHVGGAVASINTTVDRNWESTGVTPDVKVPADSALAVAERLAASSTRQ